uniref:Uncharacterized protein n=1 Tax=Arundo donax TaxID=35708 RepID=A0A0A9A281_ARUDO
MYKLMVTLCDIVLFEEIASSYYLEFMLSLFCLHFFLFL